MYGIQNICIIYMYTGNTTNIFENEYPQDLGKLSIKINWYSFHSPILILFKCTLCISVGLFTYDWLTNLSVMNNKKFIFSFEITKTHKLLHMTGEN